VRSSEDYLYLYDGFYDNLIKSQSWVCKILKFKNAHNSIEY